MLSLLNRPVDGQRTDGLTRRGFLAGAGAAILGTATAGTVLGYRRWEYIVVYHIAPENINGHGYISGEKTLCPGRYFPMREFQNDIRKQEGFS